MTTFAEWREYGENLARFSSIREKADAPMDRIVVQNKEGVQKVVAGDFGKTLIVTIGKTTQPDGRAVVSSRLFLGTLKTLKGKGEAEVHVVPTGIIMRTNFGSEIEMTNVDGYFKMLSPKPFAPDGWTARFPAGFLPKAARYLASTGEFRPFNQVLAQTHNGKMQFRANDNHIQAIVGDLDVSEPRTIHFPDHIFPALRGFEQAGGIYVPVHEGPQVMQAQFGSGRFRAVCVIYPETKTYDSAQTYPQVAEHEYTVTVQADKKVLSDTFKSLASRDPNQRVVMEAKDGAFTIRSGDTGAARLNVQCTGTGTLPVKGTFMTKVLQTVEGKTVTVQFANAPSQVRIVGDENNWPILIAPMK